MARTPKIVVTVIITLAVPVMASSLLYSIMAVQTAKSNATLRGKEFGATRINHPLHLVARH